MIQNCVFAIAVLITACVRGDTVESDGPRPDPLVGRWARIHPAGGRTDTLTLRADGTADGAAGGLNIEIDGTITRASRWKVGHEFTPGGFCIGNTKTWSCQGYRVAGDTFQLANRHRSVYLRVGARSARPGVSAAPATVAAPRPGDTVRGIERTR